MEVSEVTYQKSPGKISLIHACFNILQEDTVEDMVVG